MFWTRVTGMLILLSGLSMGAGPALSQVAAPKRTAPLPHINERAVPKPVTRKGDSDTSEPVVKDHLAITVTRGKAAFTTEEDISYRLRLTNRSKDPLWLTLTMSLAWQIELKNTSTGKTYRAQFTRPGYGGLRHWPLIELQAGKAFDGKDTIQSHWTPNPNELRREDSWYTEVAPEKKDGKIRSLPPGKYTLTVGVDLVQTTDKASLRSAIKGKALTVPLTRMTSKPVAFEIIAKK